MQIDVAKKEASTVHEGIRHSFAASKIEALISNLPFSLTDAQQRVIQEILHNLKAPFQMNRLLQGDVGSGKTVVAAVALYANFLSGYQGALMVPTEILADQHAKSIEALSPYGIRLVVLQGV